MTLKTRFSLSFIGNTLMVLALFAGTYYTFEKRAALAEQTADQMRAIVKLASVCAETHLAATPIVALTYIHALNRDPAVAGASCASLSGVVEADSVSSRIGKKLSDAELSLLNITEPLRAGAGGGPGRTLWAAPVAVEGKRVGVALLSFDKRELDNSVDQRLWKILGQLLRVAGSTLVAALAIGLMLGWNLSRPIASLVEAARSIGRGAREVDLPAAGRSDELGFLAQEMKKMSEQLKEVDELKDQFIADVSHDLRNPMSAIRMYADYILFEDPDKDKLLPEHRRMLTVMRYNATRLNVFVSNILDSAKIKAGKMEYRREPTDVAAVIQNVHALYAIVAGHMKIRYETRVAPGLPKVLADPERLEHVLSNLVSNAIKFTRENGSIVIDARVNGSMIEIRVSDTGKGIAADDLPKLFNRFSQTPDGDQRPRARGTGLGLAIVKQAMEAMGGGISVRSEKGKGSEFMVSLPIMNPGGSHGA